MDWDVSIASLSTALGIGLLVVASDDELCGAADAEDDWEEVPSSAARTAAYVPPEAKAAVRAATATNPGHWRRGRCELGGGACSGVAGGGGVVHSEGLGSPTEERGPVARSPNHSGAVSVEVP